MGATMLCGRQHCSFGIGKSPRGRTREKEVSFVEKEKEIKIEEKGRNDIRLALD